jgi:hypothetical protein
MGDVNRWVEWDPETVEVEVFGSTVIEQGDLIFLDQVNGLRNIGTSTATNKGYPFSRCSGVTETIASNQQLAYENFVGVAMYPSPSGSSQSIAVGTAGVFRFSLKAAKTIRPKSVIMPAGSGTSLLYSQKVEVWTSGSTYPLGYAMEEKTRATSAKWAVHSKVIPKSVEIPS